MNILVAPLNWGLGHASRCIPIIERLQAEGHCVVLGGDGESLTLLRKHFPDLRVLPLAPLQLTYSQGKSQVWAMLRALPRLMRSARQDHKMLANYLRYEQIDQVIADNRFGLYSDRVPCVYMTHQLTIPLPRMWRWLEPLVARLHGRVIARFAECWIPDESVDAANAVSRPLGLTQGLAGRLSHPAHMPANARYIGVLSRFAGKEYTADASYDVVAVLSGLEPQRTIFEKQIIERYANSDEQVLVVRGKMQGPPTVSRHRSITIVPWLDDNHLAAYLLGAKRIICRSGYSSVMDLAALGLLSRAELHPTPGQPEQEYLAEYLRSRWQNT